MGRALARYARGPGFESRWRLDNSPSETFGDHSIIFPEHVPHAFLVLYLEFGDKFLREREYVIGYPGV